MPLNASGPISLAGSTTGQSIALQLGLSATGQISLNDAAVRGLAGVASGAIVMPTDFYGKPTFKLYAWGRNGFSGNLGLNITGSTGGLFSYSSPVQVGALTDWALVKGGVDEGAYAIKDNGTIWSWGKAESGQLGHNNLVYRSSPTQIGALTNWSKVSGGYRYAVAVKTDGTIWSWGNNGQGQLGHNDQVTRSSPTQIGALTNWSNVAGGRLFCLATKTDGTLWSWGFNSDGQLGQNNTLGKSSPTQIGALTNWSKISSAGDFWIAIKTDGTLWACGKNGDGECGTNNPTTASSISSPVQVGALTTWATPITLKEKTALAVKTDGTLWSWGVGTRGQLGHNNNQNKSSPAQVGALTTWLDGFGANYTTFCRKTDGTLWSWGGDSDGILAQNSNNVNRSSPVQIGSLTKWGVGGASNNAAFSLLS